MRYLCTLDLPDLVCPFHCNHKTCSGNESCSYCVEDKRKKEARPKGYVRKERWYEKYYNNDTKTWSKPLVCGKGT